MIVFGVCVQVSVPCSSLFDTVTVRCGHCTNLLSVNMAAAFQSLSWQQDQHAQVYIYILCIYRLFKVFQLIPRALSTYIEAPLKSRPSLLYPADHINRLSLSPSLFLFFPFCVFQSRFSSLIKCGWFLRLNYHYY